MKKIILILFVLCCATSAKAQTSHSVAMTWVKSSTPDIASYSVYRAPCTGTVTANLCSSEGTFVKIGSVTVPTVTYTDSTVTAGGLYSFYVTAVCPSTGCLNITGLESVGSNHLGVSVPKDPLPQPPGNLTLTSVVRNSTGANTTITASWTDAPGTTTTYSVLSNGSVVSTSSAFSTTGQYSATWGGKIKPGSSIMFRVCDTAGTCDSRLL